MQSIAQPALQLDKRTIRAAIKNSESSAEVIHLVYVSDRQPGISRKRKGKIFYYREGDKKVRAKDHLERIRKLAIPPSWESVWICKLANGHLQATGLDLRKRKQYRYHTLWSALRNHTKFYRLLAFGKELPNIRKQLEKDLSLPEIPREKVLAAVVSLLERTNIRVGNAFYEKLYGSFGLTTMKDQHVSINGSRIKFSFRGKKGVSHQISLRSNKLAKIVKACRDIPGKELFQYYDGQGGTHTIDSGMVNEYIRKISCGDFTAKDFRTWTGSVHALLAFKEIGWFESEAEMKQKIPAVLDKVAAELGNTRAVCKKYYVHPIILDLYVSKKLERYINELNEGENELAKFEMAEKALMKILESN